MTTPSELTTLHNRIEATPLASELDYHNAWQAQIDANWTAEAAAFAGGLLADRLSFLFIAAYQAAVHRSFDSLGPGWAVLAITEDRSATAPKPGLVQQHHELNGYKTWVASCNLLEELVVSARSGSDTVYYQLHRTTPGLSLEARQHSGFLNDMSQGSARFDHVALTEVTPIDSPDLRQFAKREPLYLYIAYCGFLARNTMPYISLLGNLLEISTADFSSNRHKQLFADTDDAVQEVFNATRPDCFQGNYDTDKRLMSLYSAVIQKRAGRG